MSNKESKKIEPIYIPFPEGRRTLSVLFEGVDKSYDIGILNFVPIMTEDAVEYHGAMQFGSSFTWLKGLSNTPFPLREVTFDNQTGAISFQILGAVKVFEPNKPVSRDFHFEFEGVYDDSKGAISGTGGVPMDFSPIGPTGKSKDGPQEDGQTVHWTSAGIGDPDNKPSI
jgi:hypothetical protein